MTNENSQSGEEPKHISEILAEGIVGEPDSDRADKNAVKDLEGEVAGIEADMDATHDQIREGQVLDQTVMDEKINAHIEAKEELRKRENE